jgi:hypothetical protein
MTFWSMKKIIFFSLRFPYPRRENKSFLCRGEGPIINFSSALEVLICRGFAAPASRDFDRYR